MAKNANRGYLNFERAGAIRGLIVLRRKSKRKKRNSKEYKQMT